MFLGTLGNNAPFIGLLGTVLGVIEAFHQLSGGPAKAAMGNVMTGIAEALVATGVGLFVALPAVVAYNVGAKRAADIANQYTVELQQMLSTLAVTEAQRAEVLALFDRADASAFDDVAREWQVRVLYGPHGAPDFFTKSMTWVFDMPSSIKPGMNPRSLIATAFS